MLLSYLLFIYFLLIYLRLFIYLFFYLRCEDKPTSQEQLWFES